MVAATCLATLAGASPSRAETLAEAIASVWGTNPSLLAQRAALRASDEDYVQSRAQFGLSASITATDTYDTVGRWSPHEPASHYRADNAGMELVFTHPLYTGGRITANLNAVDAQIHANRENLRRIEQDLLVQTTAAFLAVRRDEQTATISADYVTSLVKQLQDTNDQFAVRQVTLTDVKQAEARLAGGRVELANLQSQLRISRAQYASIVGHPPIDLQPEPDLEALPPNLDKAFDLAEGLNPTVGAALFTEMASRQKVAATKALRRPTVNAQLSLSSEPYAPYMNDVRDNSLTASVAMTMPLYASGQYESETRQAIAQASRDQYLLDDAQRTLVFNVSQAWDQLSTARQVLKTLDQQMRSDLAALYGERQEKQFALRTTIEVLNAEAEAEQAQVALIRGRYTEYLGRVQLLAAVGSLRVEDLSANTPAYDPLTHFRAVQNKGALPSEAISRALDAVRPEALMLRPRLGLDAALKPASTALAAAPVAAAKTPPLPSILDVNNPDVITTARPER